MIPDATQHALKQLSLALAVLGFCVGLLLSYGVLIGDAQGRVNLLFLLLLFAFVPVAGLVLSLLLLLRGGGRGLAGLLLALPLWPRHLTLALPRLASFRGGKLWLFYQTQILSLSFSCGCLLLYILLLLGSDISFVWRSTLLEPGNLLPTLQALALPWRFWPEAQPSLALIEITRDYRSGLQDVASPLVGLWWKYILAAQVSYNLLPRSVMLVVARSLYARRLREAQAAGAMDFAQGSATAPPRIELADVVTTVTAPYLLLDWADLPATGQDQVQHRLGAAASVRKLGPLPSSPDPVADSSQSIVVLVKSWEPPLGELADRLRTLESRYDTLLLPLDWNADGIRQATPAHLEEWRRFAATLPGWRVLRLEDIP